MSAMTIYQHAPLGSLIRYSDGAAKPPARFTRKLAAWEQRNGVGRLVQKSPARQYATVTSPATITLREGDIASNGIILVTVMRTHSVDSGLTFEIVGQPPSGAVRELRDYGDSSELLHLADSREAAERWLMKNPYVNVRLEIVGADEAGDTGPGPAPVTAA